ncbi:peptidoglycan-binding protein [Methanobrevibacter sp.]|uniref:peptidoglycan-binding protein n=1 Tax=Methanobrevibacter sp. TaxID=66852 RepID=UPI0038911999
MTNCNFINNSASWDGGAVYFGDEGTVTNCNFNCNKATGFNGWGGAILFVDTGNVRNCNFTNNTATNGNGGAIRFNIEGTVTNCNFTGNNATTGSAIYFGSTSATKTVSNSCFLNNRANAEALEVTKNDNNITITFKGNDNLLNAIYSNGEVSFTNVTYWSAKGIANTGSSAIKPSRSNKEAGQNITVGVVVNGELVLSDVKVTDENGMIVLDISTGENYYISAHHDADSYYTEAEKTISNNTKFSVNVTSQTTNNRTVNITAKSNIPNEVIKGELRFILPNSEEISANYAGNGTWWVLYTFADYGVYEVNASYTGLDSVTVNNANITVNKANSTLTVGDIVFDYNSTGSTTISFTGATGVDASVVEHPDANVNVNGNTITVSGLNAGNYTLSVTTIADANHNNVTKTAKVTVNKINSTLTVSNVVFNYGDSGSATVSFTGATGVNASVDDQPDANVNVNADSITVSGLDAGNYTLTVTTIADANHNNVTKTAKITVNKIDSTLTVENVVFDYDSTGSASVSFTGAIGVNASVVNQPNAVVDVEGNIITVSGLDAGNYTLTVTTIADANHNNVTRTAKVTVKKATPKITAKAKTFKTTTKTKKYVIVLKNNVNKAINKATVYLKVSGKTYKATTNSKGKATFKITKLSKKGTYKAAITYKGNTYYNKATKKVTIKVKAVWKTVSRGSKAITTVKKIQKALKKNGYYVPYPVDGIYQKYTETAVKQFQKAKGLKVTGKVDEKTANKLGLI